MTPPERVETRPEEERGNTYARNVFDAVPLRRDRQRAEVRRTWDSTGLDRFGIEIQSWSFGNQIDATGPF